MAENCTEPVDVRRVLGRELKEARRAAGYTQASLANLIGYSRSTVSNAEIGQPDVARAFWESADNALRTGGALTSVYDQIRRSRIAGRADTAIAVISGCVTAEALPAGTVTEVVASLLEFLALELGEAARMVRKGAGR